MTADGRYLQGGLDDVDPAILWDTQSSFPTMPSISSPSGLEDEDEEVAAIEVAEWDPDPFKGRTVLQQTMTVMRTKRAASGVVEVRRPKKTMYDLINRMSTAVTQESTAVIAKDPSSRRERAILTLQSEYAKLRDEDFAITLELFEDDKNVVIFNALYGDRRNTWLKAKVVPGRAESLDIDTTFE